VVATVKIELENEEPNLPFFGIIYSISRRLRTYQNVKYSYSISYVTGVSLAL